MKKRCLFILSLLLSCVLYSQDNSLIKTFDSSVEVSFSKTKEEFTWSKQKRSKNNDRLKITAIQLDKGNLLINYELSEFRPSEKKSTIKLKPTLVFNNGDIFYAHPKDIEGNLESKFSSDPKQLQMIWHDFQENYRFSDESFLLSMEGSLAGKLPIDCNIIPEFGVKQRLPHYLIAGAGVGIVISGFVIDESHKQLYDDYIDQVFDGSPDAESTYSKANNRNKLGSFLKNAGYVVSGANAIVYAVRYLSYKRKKKDYDYYCKERKIGMAPYYEYEPHLASPSLGMQVVYNF